MLELTEEMEEQITDYAVDMLQRETEPYDSYLYEESDSTDETN